ncbi:MAG TPA: branched-chain amino acid ABC transporter permease [Ktedonobacteraceae bacterium]|nr:branched-chain amino acid ABC transporter permease [Ktedonobacteraceae bacterium]
MPILIFYLLTLAIFGAIYGTLALGLNIQWGYTGILDFMYIAFVAVGGYVTSLLMLQPSQPALGETYVLGLNWPFIPAILVGGLAAALLAFIVGILSLNRLRSDYFAIVTVAVGLVLYTIAGNDTPLVNGWDGLSAIPQPFQDALNLDYNTYQFFFLGMCIVILILVYIFSERLYRSPFGRALRSVREDEMVAQGLGKNVFALRLKAFVIGAFIAGIGGALLVIYVDAFNPSAWTTGETFFLWAALLLGGSANNRGALLGALIVPVLFAEATRLLPNILPPNILSPQYVDSFRYIAIGILLILTVRFRPQGILAEKRFRVRKSKLLEPAVATAGGPVPVTDADLADNPGTLTDGNVTPGEEGNTL